MADYNDAFKSSFEHSREHNYNQIRTIYTTEYDTTCPKCKDHGYCVTNDGGSIGGCLKCNITYTSKSHRVKQVIKGDKIISRERIVTNPLDPCATCGLPRNNHRTYHQFDEAEGKFNP